MGLFQAKRKAFVADGGSWLWKLFREQFKPFGFVGGLGLMHALGDVYASAMVGRSASEGGIVYRR